MENKNDKSAELIQLLGKEQIRKKNRSKRIRYAYLKEKANKLVPWIYQQIENGNQREIFARARDFAKELNLEAKSDYSLYTGLRFLFYYEGIDLSMKYNGQEIFFIMRILDGCGAEGLPRSIVKTLDNIELDGWYIKRKHDYLQIKHSLKRQYNQEIKQDIYILESEGNIYFDKRILNEDQALEFVKYMSSKDVQGPDMVYLTPINVVVSDKLLDNFYRYYNFRYFDFEKTGKEFRIVKTGNDEFTVTSIYGKECILYEYDIDSLLKSRSLHSLLMAFDKASEIEKVPQRIEILKKIIPEIKSQNAVMIEGRRLLINNTAGTFHLSLIDGTLHKISGYNESNKNRNGGRYICVGPIGNNNNGSIIFDGIRYDIDRITDSIISKMKMLLDEKYPDSSTEIQIKSRVS
jgi:hypothetical protein